ncbi:DUF1176 domain-containing protein [Arthrospira platensis]|jgi:hypothetical protein|uniref:DUF1176 domain-containing protein n=1 Tax=Limnospira platensis NIES-46 TaxID=1236695 RepID=A0A5M3T9Z7_LIMPL|nr:DUF1176 domain-containing protein [Arthrospira platensis]AMW29895.1 hypothetical protein AP285_20120 [Arthrospira platensis YZ]KDR54282.1 hypothetical protein APPUASWS_029880 [Arthrospira platensis str. Paraca]MBD2669755.1 DUF1176 domain-containing protein [Arthrospira platensis FACHB-439]MBD2710495.1 DUF1176 domain-containing protein [Arthrospira platensis FACHB-835]MDF2212072.1 DUF1176 domain-containing protein [Arthrospira platensis NCB002]MDT9184177.1 DUF1176 domain-containing protein 
MRKLALSLAIACLFFHYGSILSARARTDLLSQTPSPQPDQVTPQPSDEELDQGDPFFRVPEPIMQYFYSNSQQLNICPGGSSFPFQVGSFAYPLGTQGYLVQLLCFQAAYQNNYNFFVDRETNQGVNVGRVKLPKFEINSSGQRVETQMDEVVGLVDYEPVQGVLTVFTKYRGIGDCGSFAKYQWDQVDFKAIEYREKSDCDGNFVDPENYPQIYP